MSNLTLCDRFNRDTNRISMALAEVPDNGFELIPSDELTRYLITPFVDVIGRFVERHLRGGKTITGAQWHTLMGELHRAAFVNGSPIPYCVGGQITFIDVQVTVLIGLALEEILEMTAYPELSAIAARCNALPAFQS